MTASYTARLARRAQDAPFALCAGIDPAPQSLALLEAGVPATAPGRATRVTRAGAIERFAGLIIESVRDHAVAIKPQVAWFEAAGAPGIRALERTVAFARTAGLLVVLDAKRGDVPHTANAYADAWLGEDAASGIGGDALTVNASVGMDSMLAMAAVAAERQCALYALLHTSNPGAAALQAVELATHEPWWHMLARELQQVDASVGGGVVGAVVGATRPEVVGQARALLPAAPLLLPGIGAQGGEVADLAASAPGTAPTSLVPMSRSLLPTQLSSVGAFRFAVDAAAGRAAAGVAHVGARTTLR